MEVNESFDGWNYSLPWARCTLWCRNHSRPTLVCLEKDVLDGQGPAAVCWSRYARDGLNMNRYEVRVWR